MLVYSQWRPDGGYSYYGAEVVAPLGDDLPNPIAGRATELGVPSSEIGQPLPRAARYLGEGALPTGVVVPMDRSRLGQVRFEQWCGLGWFVIGMASMGALCWLLSRERRWAG
jgi:hypothetical protein